MNEFIPFTPEREITSERFAWDNILRALEVLSEFDEELDLFEAVNDLKDEEFEDGLMMVFNYAVMVTVPEDESSELDLIMQFLEDHKILNGTGGEQE